MRKIVLVYGLIAAAIFAITMFGAFPFWKNGTITFENGKDCGGDKPIDKNYFFHIV